MPSHTYFSHSLLFLLMLPALAFGQSNASIQQTRVLNANGGFEEGIEGWNHREIASTVLVRDWAPAGEFPFEAYGSLESQLVQLKGKGVWGQTFSIQGTQPLQILNVQAFRQSIVDDTAGSYACAEVTYYDANWVELDSITIPIDGRDERKNRGVGDGLNFYSWGIRVPAGATNAFLSIYNSEDTETYVDGFRLFEYSQTAKVPLTKNLIPNPSFTQVFGPNQQSAQGYGVEFWESERDWSREFFRMFGTPLQAELAYQFVPVQPNKTYTLSALVSGPATTPSGVGMDFYDKNWTHIGAQAINFAGRFGSELQRIESPSATAYASVWVWCDQLNPGDSSLFVGGIFLQKQADTVSRATSIMASDIGLRGGKGGTIGSVVVVVYSDVDGIDATSIDNQDAYYTSRSTSNLTYPADVYTKKLSEDGKTMRVEYLAKVAWHTDAAALVIRSKQVRDKLGNFASSKTFKPLQLP